MHAQQRGEDMKHSSRVFVLALLADVVLAGQAFGQVPAGALRTQGPAATVAEPKPRSAISSTGDVAAASNHGTASAGSPVGAAAGASGAPRDLFKADDNALIIVGGKPTRAADLKTRVRAALSHAAGGAPTLYRGPQ